MSTRVYLAWTGAPPDLDGSRLDGPWEEARCVADGVWLLESHESLSAVYHALKWSLPDDAPLVVAPLPHTPKSRGLAPGTTSWLRSRTTRPA